jgi:hypothetical protein
VRRRRFITAFWVAQEEVRRIGCEVGAHADVSSAPAAPG